MEEDKSILQGIIDENTQEFLNGYGFPIVAFVFAVLLVRFIATRVKSGPSEEELEAFKVPSEGGALQRMKKDAAGNVNLKLAKKIKITDDTYIFRFSFEDPDLTFGLPIGNHVIFKAPIGENGEQVSRKYTPISDVLNTGFVDFVIKIYRKNVHPKFPEGGLMTQHLESLNPGNSLLVQGPVGRLQYHGFGNFEILRRPFPNHRTNIGMLAGGTGITPIYSVLQSSLRNEDKNTMSLLFGNRTVDDILMKEELTQLQAGNEELFKLHFTVD